MRILLKKRKYSLVWALLLACLVGTSQAMAKDRYEVFKDKVPAGARISVPDAVREGGSSEKSTHYIYVQPSETPTRISGLSIPIRENPRPGAIPLYYICLDQMGRRGNRYAIGREKCEG